MAITLTVVPGACAGGPGETELTLLSERVEDAQATLDSATDDAAAIEARNERCRSQINPLVDALGDLDSVLSTVGLTYAEYGEYLNDVAVAYGRINFGNVGYRCLNAALPAEKAMNRYADAGEAWSDCMIDFGCDIDSIDSTLQSEWGPAGTAVSRARSKVSRLDSGNEDSEERIAELEEMLADAETTEDELRAGNDEAFELDWNLLVRARDWAKAFADGDHTDTCAIVSEGSSAEDDLRCDEEGAVLPSADYFTDAEIESYRMLGAQASVTWDTGHTARFQRNNEVWKVHDFGPDVDPSL